ncbi:MAG: uroporphyrinogen decarboxylase family protein [Candidatus Humimicrobiaceae bacterium]
MVESKKILPYEGNTDKERLLAAFRREPVDRVPNFEILIEDKHVEKILGKYAGNTLAYGGDPAKGANAEAGRPMFPNDFIDLCEIIGQDALMFDGGLWTPFKKQNENGEWVNAYSKDVKTRADYEALKLDSDAAIASTVGYIKEYKEALAKRNSKLGVTALFGCLIQTLYEFVCGMNDFMMMVYEDRDLVEEMLEDSTVHFVNMSKAMVAAGVDFIFPADDVAFKTGLFIPPKIFKEIWVPRMRRIFEPAVNAGIPVMFHSDGKIDDIVEDLIDMGLNCLNPMDPYGIDYSDYKKRYGSRLCLSGNYDVEFPLGNGTPDQIEADVKARMEIMKPGYGYVATCSHSIVNYIPHENYIAYINSIHKYGKY